MSDELRWVPKETSTPTDYKIFTVRKQLSQHPASRREAWFTQVHSPDWVNVIALTPDDDVVLVKQYRHGIDTITTELPGGMVDPGEDPVQAGLRELQEETGYRPREAYLLGTVHPNPAFLTNRCALVLALDAVPNDTRSLDPNEFIEVATAPFDHMADWVLDGRITHSLVVSAFFFLQNQVGALRRPTSEELPPRAWP